MDERDETSDQQGKVKANLTVRSLEKCVHAAAEKHPDAAANSSRSISSNKATKPKSESESERGSNLADWQTGRLRLCVAIFARAKCWSVCQAEAEAAKCRERERSRIKWPESCN